MNNEKWRVLICGSRLDIGRGAKHGLRVYVFNYSDKGTKIFFKKLPVYW